MRKIVTPVQVTHTDGEEEHYTVLRTLVMTTTHTRWHHGTQGLVTLHSLRSAVAMTDLFSPVVPVK